MNWFKRRKQVSLNNELLALFSCTEAERCSDKDKRREQWIEKNPDQIEAYDRFDMLYQELNIFAASITDEENQQYSMESSHSDTLQARTGYFTLPVYAVAASVITAAILLFVLAPYFSSDTQTYHTGYGERLVVNLSDDTIIYLNAHTRLSVVFDTAQRAVRLIRGEALFEVAHDTNRPFSVWTKTGVVNVLGTRFNVNADLSDVSVTVLDGTVLVSAGSGDKKSSENSQIGTQGQQIVIGQAGKLESNESVNLEQVISWTRGKLIFSGESLDHVVKKINLHSKQHFSLNDSRLYQLPIYGVFNMGDTAGFISALKEVYPMDAVVVSERETVLFFKPKEKD